MDFKPIAELSKRAKIQMNINTEKDEMEVLMFITLKEGAKGSSLNLEPLVFTGTAEKLDEELPAMVALLMNNNKTVLDQISRISTALKQEESKTIAKATGKKESVKKEAVKEPTVDMFADVAPEPPKEKVLKTEAEVEDNEIIASVTVNPKNDTVEVVTEKPEMPEIKEQPTMSFSDFKEEEAKKVVKADPNKARTEKRYAEMEQDGWKLDDEGKLFLRDGVSVTSASIQQMDDSQYELALQKIEEQMMPEAPEPPKPEARTNTLEDRFTHLMELAKSHNIKTEGIIFENFNTEEKIMALTNKLESIIASLTNPL